MASFAIVKFLCDSRLAYNAKIDSIGSFMRVSTFSFVPLLSTKFTIFLFQLMTPLRILARSLILGH